METIVAFEQLIPESIELFRKRYTLLQAILENEPIGRRTLAQLTASSERIIRSEVDILSQQELIHIASTGMRVSDEGKKILHVLYRLYQDVEGLSKLEKNLEELLELKRAIVVKGDADEDDSAKYRLGNAGVELLSSLLKDHFTIAVTGGTTIAKMVEAMPVQKSNWKDITVVPARGSIGPRVEFQANTIAVELAKKLDAKYEQLNIPDNLSESSINSIKTEPYLQKTLSSIKQSEIILFGLGNALKMAKRRKETPEVIKLLEERQAVAEVFRYYFDQQGEVVHSTKNIGLDWDLAKEVPIRIAVAGGKSKATAIMAVKKILQGSYLIIDEGAAKEILKISIH